jgi:hypothetical protein
MDRRALNCHRQISSVFDVRLSQLTKERKVDSADYYRISQWGEMLTKIRTVYKERKKTSYSYRNFHLFNVTARL